MVITNEYMNILKSIDQYNQNYVFFFEPIKNNILSDGNFIRIVYSTPQFILNGIYLLIQLNEIIIEKYYNKYKCNFNVTTHEYLLQSIKKIEENILEKYSIGSNGTLNKIPNYKIYEQMKNGNIKIFSENIKKSVHYLFVLKISGIWETDTCYGLTYKFIKINE